MKRTPLTTEEAVARIRADYPSDGNVMAQNYDHDCPNSDDHTIDPVTGFEVCECWDGLTVDDIATWTEDDSQRVDLDGFAQWGPFELWEEEDEMATEPTDDYIALCREEESAIAQASQELLRERLAAESRGEEWSAAREDRRRAELYLKYLDVAGIEIRRKDGMSTAERAAFGRLAFSDSIDPSHYWTRRGRQSGHMFANNGRDVYDLTADEEVENAEDIEEADAIVANQQEEV